jgi:transcriptional regulator with XRE-family HTH domain
MMSGQQLRSVRHHLRLTQQQAAKRWRVSQAYLSLMERGRRSVPVRLARRLARGVPTLATALPLDESVSRVADLPASFGALGYPGFAYLADPRGAVNPAAAVFAALRAGQVPARVTEALPWVLMTFADLDWNWLVDHAKLANRQNRLGYFVTLAREVAEREGRTFAVTALTGALHRLEQARLANEDTLGRDLTDVERRHARQHRPAGAAHWNLLTSLRSEDLRYGA